MTRKHKTRDVRKGQYVNYLKRAGLVVSNEAERVMKDCERFLEYVKGRLPVP